MLPLTALLEVGGKLVDKLIPDPEARARAQAELLKMEQDGDLARMANETKVLEIASANTADARDMQKVTKSRMPAFLSVITVVGFFTLIIGSALGKLQLTGSDIMMMLLGVLARETASVYNFWLGSSNSSQQKDIMKGNK
jgi:hypothetical protein